MRRRHRYTLNATLARIGRGLRKPPRVIARRILDETRAELDRWRIPRREARFGGEQLLALTGEQSLSGLWERLAARPFPAYTRRLPPAEYEHLCPGDGARILAAADRALAHEVDLLGSGPVGLGQTIDWSRDYGSGFDWPPAYMRDIDYANPERPSDVKFPWELSRLQWLVPAGQAYLLSGEERYAAGVRRVLEQWMAANPYAHTVNWACTMEAALRIFTWSWFFHVFAHSEAWRDESFRARFLVDLYLHGRFTFRYLERSDINGNHFTADAAALVVAGTFFGEGRESSRWQDQGWQGLRVELPRQVCDDGVCFEVSTAYHRLVCELFFWAARFRAIGGQDVPREYVQRLLAMAGFTAAYTRDDGSVPLWGDADDARVLPFGGQPVTDHSYLPPLLAAAFGAGGVDRCTPAAAPELCWALGPDHAPRTGRSGVDARSPASRLFAAGGVCIMRSANAHVFIDCGPVGLAGRGGHGHNDCLHVDAVLDGCHLLSDSGSYLYTASYAWRNRFRSSSFHNSPVVDDQEQNRFVGEQYLWNLHFDAVPSVLEWRSTKARDVFEGMHAGYRRLSDPVDVRRRVVLDRRRSSLLIHDRFSCAAIHRFAVSFQLAPGVEIVEPPGHGPLRLRCAGRDFTCGWRADANWVPVLEAGWVSPRYGVRVEAPRLRLESRGHATGLLFAICAGALDAESFAAGLTALADETLPGGTA